jgi:hypothetical protein
MAKTVKPLTLTRAQVGGCIRRDAAVKKCAAQLDSAINSNKSAAQLKLTMKAVKTKLRTLPPHFGRNCPVM